MTDRIRRVGPGDEGTLAHIQSESWKAAFDAVEICYEKNLTT